MLSLSSASDSDPVRALRGAAVAGAFVAASLASGAASAVLNWLPLAAAGALAVLLWLALAPSVLALGSLLVVRGLTDAIADVPIVAGLNAGALIGLTVVASALLLVVLRAPARGVVIGAALLAAVVYWFGIGVLQHGMHPSLMREVVRSASIVAVALLAVNGDRSLTPSRMATIVVLAALIPALLIVFEGLANWQAMVHGSLRPRGTLSHPNAASILFGIALPMSAWRWAYGGGGRRYLLAAGLFGVAIVLTRSMGGLAQAVVTLFVFTLVQEGHGAQRAVLGLATAAIVAAFVFDPFGISRVSELESTSLATSSTGEIDNTFEWRLVNWRMFLDEWRDSPLLGHGLGSTNELVTPLHHLPHSDPVRFLVETGLAGVALLAAGYVVLVNRLLLLARLGVHRSFAAAVLAVVVGVSVHSLATHVSLNTQPIYVVAALAGWTLAMPLAEPRARDRSARDRGQPAVTASVRPGPLR
jgi:O-antigen ligase